MLLFKAQYTMEASVHHLLSIAICGIGKTDFQMVKEKKWTLHKIGEMQKPL